VSKFVIGIGSSELRVSIRNAIGPATPAINQNTFNGH
jgi:hypothetical protein